MLRIILSLFFLFSCFSQKASEGLATQYTDFFDIGVAISNTDLADKEVMLYVNMHFSSVTHEFAMKWSKVEVSPGRYEFDRVDSFVNDAIKNGRKVIGHTLVWHRANPAWLFELPEYKISKRDYFLDKLRSHIFTMVGRYRGKVYGWDVVNEAIYYDGSYRKSPWLELIGEDYIEKAFEYAHQADPSAELYYNDYGLENIKKQDTAVAIIERLKAKGIPVHGVGIQGHSSLTYPNLDLLDKAIDRFAALGVKVMITELDVSVLAVPGAEERGEDAVIDAARSQELNPFPDELPDEVKQQFTDRYRDIFCVLLKHKNNISRVTFWGLSDARSWRNSWPLPGRTDYPLLFDRAMKPKLVVGVLRELPTDPVNNCK